MTDERLDWLRDYDIDPEGLENGCAPCAYCKGKGSVLYPRYRTDPAGPVLCGECNGSGLALDGLAQAQQFAMETAHDEHEWHDNREMNPRCMFCNPNHWNDARETQSKEALTIRDMEPEADDDEPWCHRCKEFGHDTLTCHRDKSGPVVAATKEKASYSQCGVCLGTGKPYERDPASRGHVGCQWCKGSGIIADYQFDQGPFKNNYDGESAARQRDERSIATPRHEEEHGTSTYNPNCAVCQFYADDHADGHPLLRQMAEKGGLHYTVDKALKTQLCYFCTQDYAKRKEDAPVWKRPFVSKTESRTARYTGNIEEEIASYAAHAGRGEGDSAPYNSESLAEIYEPRVRQLIDLQNQGYTHAEWKFDHEKGENHWHGIDEKDASIKQEVVAGVQEQCVVCDGTSKPWKSGPGAGVDVPMCIFCKGSGIADRSKMKGQVGTEYDQIAYRKNLDRMNEDMVQRGQHLGPINSPGGLDRLPKRPKQSASDLSGFEQCPACDGTGRQLSSSPMDRVPGPNGTCRLCKASGIASTEELDEVGQWGTECPTCAGKEINTGQITLQGEEIWKSPEDCPTCHGDGTLPEPYRDYLSRQRAKKTVATKTAGIEECGYCHGNGRAWEYKDGDWVRGKMCPECKGAGVRSEVCSLCGERENGHYVPEHPNINPDYTRSGICPDCRKNVILFDDDVHYCPDHGFKTEPAKTRLVMPAKCPSCDSSETRGRYQRGGWREYTCLDCGNEFKNRDSKVASLGACPLCEGTGNFADQMCMICKGSGLAAPWEEQARDHVENHGNWAFNKHCGPCQFMAADHQDGHPLMRMNIAEDAAPKKVDVDKELKTQHCYVCTQNYLKRKEDAPVWKRPFVSQISGDVFGHMKDRHGLTRTDIDEKHLQLGHMFQHRNHDEGKQLLDDPHTHDNTARTAHYQCPSCFTGDHYECPRDDTCGCFCHTRPMMNTEHQQWHKEREAGYNDWEECYACHGSGKGLACKNCGWRTYNIELPKCGCGNDDIDDFDETPRCYRCKGAGLIPPVGKKADRTPEQEAKRKAFIDSRGVIMCDDCHGNGRFGDNAKCVSCKGTGLIIVPGLLEYIEKDAHESKDHILERHECKKCGTTGQYGGQICNVCKGSGIANWTQRDEDWAQRIMNALGPHPSRRPEAHVGDDNATHHSNSDKLMEEHPYWTQCPDCGGDGIDVASTDVQTGEQKQKPCKTCAGIGEAHDFEYWDSDDQLHDFANYPAFKEMKIPEKTLKGHLKDVHEQVKYDDSYVHHQTIHGINVDPEIAQVLINGKQASSAHYVKCNYCEGGGDQQCPACKGSGLMTEPKPAVPEQIGYFVRWKPGNTAWGDGRARSGELTHPFATQEEAESARRMGTGPNDDLEVYARPLGWEENHFRSFGAKEYEDCWMCSGKGEVVVGDNRVRCPECKGSQIKPKESAQEAEELGGLNVKSMTCKYCKDGDTANCGSCGGTGTKVVCSDCENPVVDGVGGFSHKFGDDTRECAAKKERNAEWRNLFAHRRTAGDDYNVCGLCNGSGTFNGICPVCRGSGIGKGVVGETATGWGGKCRFCPQPITEVRDDYSGVYDYVTPGGDYGCIDNPITNEEGTGGHFPEGKKHPQEPGDTGRRDYIPKVGAMLAWKKVSTYTRCNTCHGEGFHIAPLDKMMGKQPEVCIDCKGSGIVPQLYVGCFGCKQTGWDHEGNSCQECNGYGWKPIGKHASAGDTTDPMRVTQTPNFLPSTPRGKDPWKDFGDNGLPQHNPGLYFDPDLKEWITKEQYGGPTKQFVQASGRVDTYYYSNDDKSHEIRVDDRGDGKCTCGWEAPTEAPFDPKDWNVCTVCKGTGVSLAGLCGHCKGSGVNAPSPRRYFGSERQELATAHIRDSNPKTDSRLALEDHFAEQHYHQVSGGWDDAKEQHIHSPEDGRNFAEHFINEQMLNNVHDKLHAPDKCSFCKGTGECTDDIRLRRKDHGEGSTEYPAMDEATQIERLKAHTLCKGEGVCHNCKGSGYIGILAGHDHGETKSAGVKGPKVTFVQGDITKQDTDAIVNAANEALLGGGGVDGAIHKAAGPSVLEECKQLRATTYPDGLKAGEAAITGAGDLPAKYIIHAVGPRYAGPEAHPNPEEALRSAHTEALKRADEVGAESVSFPAISTGIFGYPLDEASKVAVDAVRNAKTNVKEVRFVSFDDKTHAAYSAHDKKPWYRRAQTWTQSESEDAPSPDLAPKRRKAWDPWEDEGDAGELTLPAPSGDDIKKWKTVKTFPGDKSFADHPQNQDHVDMGQVVGGKGLIECSACKGSGKSPYGLGWTAGDLCENCGGSGIAKTCEECGDELWSPSAYTVYVTGHKFLHVTNATCKRYGSKSRTKQSGYEWIDEFKADRGKSDVRSCWLCSGAGSTRNCPKGLGKVNKTLECPVCELADLNFLRGNSIHDRRGTDPHLCPVCNGSGLNHGASLQDDPLFKTAEESGISDMREVVGAIVAYRDYECTACGNVQKVQTNHFRQCMSRCANCSWKGYIPEGQSKFLPPGDRMFAYKGGGEYIPCPECDGGKRATENYAGGCFDCHGSGLVRTSKKPPTQDDPLFKIASSCLCRGTGITDICGTCGGRGTVFTFPQECPECKGSGKTEYRVCGWCDGTGTRKYALLDYDPVRDVNPSTESAPAPSAQGSGGDPWPDQGDNGTAPPRPGLIFDPKLKKWIQQEQGTYPDIGVTFPGGATDVNKIGKVSGLSRCPTCNGSGANDYVAAWHEEQGGRCAYCKGSGLYQREGQYSCINCGHWFLHSRYDKWDKCPGCGEDLDDFGMREYEYPRDAIMSDHNEGKHDRAPYRSFDRANGAECPYCEDNRRTSSKESSDDNEDSVISAACQTAEEFGVAHTQCSGVATVPGEDHDEERRCECHCHTGTDVIKQGAYRFHVKPKPGVEVPTDLYEACGECEGSGFCPEDGGGFCIHDYHGDWCPGTCGTCKGSGLKMDDDAFPNNLHRDKMTPVEPHGIWDRQEKQWVDQYGRPSEDYWATTKDTAQMRSRDLNERVRDGLHVGKVADLHDPEDREYWEQRWDKFFEGKPPKPAIESCGWCDGIGTKDGDVCFLCHGSGLLNHLHKEKLNELTPMMQEWMKRRFAAKDAADSHYPGRKKASVGKVADLHDPHDREYWKQRWDDIYAGKPHEPAIESCYHCGGSSVRDGELCKVCHGAGLVNHLNINRLEHATPMIQERLKRKYASKEEAIQPCFICDGMGTLPTDNWPWTKAGDMCTMCKGSGLVNFLNQEMLKRFEDKAGPDLAKRYKEKFADRDDLAKTSGKVAAAYDRIVGYTYDADTHCVDCAKKKFGDPDYVSGGGYYGCRVCGGSGQHLGRLCRGCKGSGLTFQADGYPRDSEGNEVHAMLAFDEHDGPATCGTCRETFCTTCGEKDVKKVPNELCSGCEGSGKFKGEACPHCDGLRVFRNVYECGNCGTKSSLDSKGSGEWKFVSSRHHGHRGVVVPAGVLPDGEEEHNQPSKMRCKVCGHEGAMARTSMAWHVEKEHEAEVPRDDWGNPPISHESYEYVPRLSQQYGANLKGNGIRHDDPCIPDTVYHVTTRADEVETHGHLHAGFGGGLQGSSDNAVSMTTNRKIAEQLADDFKLVGGLAQSYGRTEHDTDEREQEGHMILRSLVDKSHQEGWDYSDHAKWLGSMPHALRGYGLHDHLNSYFSQRNRLSGRPDPLFFGGEQYAKIDPAQVGIVTIPKKHLDNGAQLTNFDVDKPYGLSEIRSYGDVNVGHLERTSSKAAQALPQQVGDHEADNGIDDPMKQRDRGKARKVLPGTQKTVPGNDELNGSIDSQTKTGHTDVSSEIGDIVRHAAQKSPILDDLSDLARHIIRSHDHPGEMVGDPELYNDAELDDLHTYDHLNGQNDHNIEVLRVASA